MSRFWLCGHVLFSLVFFTVFSLVFTGWWLNITHAIIRYTADHHGVLSGGNEPSGAPRRDGEAVREGDYIVYPLEGGDEALTAVEEVWSDLEPVEVTYVNMLGMQSATPFDGMNIVVTRYSNGMITAIKVMR